MWPFEWLMVFGWIALGVILYLVGLGSYGRVSAAEREVLIFGPELARPEVTGGEVPKPQEA